MELETIERSSQKPELSEKTSQIFQNGIHLSNLNITIEFSYLLRKGSWNCSNVALAVTAFIASRLAPERRQRC